MKVWARFGNQFGNQLGALGKTQLHGQDKRSSSETQWQTGKTDQTLPSALSRLRRPASSVKFGSARSTTGIDVRATGQSAVSINGINERQLTFQFEHETREACEQPGHPAGPEVTRTPARRE